MWATATTTATAAVCVGMCVSMRVCMQWKELLSLQLLLPLMLLFLL